MKNIHNHSLYGKLQVTIYLRIDLIINCDLKMYLRLKCTLPFSFTWFKGMLCFCTCTFSCVVDYECHIYLCTAVGVWLQALGL